MSVSERFPLLSESLLWLHWSYSSPPTPYPHVCCIYVRVHVGHTCRGYRRTCDSSIALHSAPYCLRWVSLTRKLTVLARVAGRWTLGMCLLCVLPTARVTGTGCQAQLLHGCWEIKLMLAQQALSRWAIFPALLYKHPSNAC